LATVIPPTATPNLYTVELNDTLTGIARKFNITPEELLAANPSAGSQALTVGQVLTIPTRQETSAVPTATPWPVTIQQTQCYPNQDGSLWCLALLKNEYAETLQNLSVVISLQDSSGKPLSSLPAYAPLDLLPSGKSIAIGALFPAPILDGYRSQVHLLSASLLASTDNRYPSIHLQNNLVQVDWGGMSARVSGQAVLNPQSGDASRVWILGVAYDQSGNVIGFRRWESNNPLSSADVLSFDFLIASLGPEIDHVELLVEAAK
jgi:LysM repeat protein